MQRPQHGLFVCVLVFGLCWITRQGACEFHPRAMMRNEDRRAGLEKLRECGQRLCNVSLEHQEGLSPNSPLLWEPHYYGKGNSRFAALHKRFVASAEVWLKFEVLKKSGIQVGQREMAHRILTLLYRIIFRAKITSIAFTPCLHIMYYAVSLNGSEGGRYRFKPLLTYISI